MPVTKVNLKSFLVTELLRDFMIEASIYWWQLQKWPYLQFWICSSFIYSAINISTCIELFNINENYQVLPCLHGLSCILWKVIWSWAWRFKDAMKWLFYGDVILFSVAWWWWWWWWRTLNFFFPKFIKHILSSLTVVQGWWHIYQYLVLPSFVR